MSAAPAIGTSAPGSDREHSPVDEVVEALTVANADIIHRPRGRRSHPALPSPEAVATAMRGLRAALFPWHFGAEEPARRGLDRYIAETLKEALSTLQDQVLAGCLYECEHDADPPREPKKEDGHGARRCLRCDQRAEQVTRHVMLRLPTIRALLETDAWAAFHGDPAATSPDEAVFCYPGMTAITFHRIAHEIHSLGVPLVPRMVSEFSHDETGIDIHPGAQIGASFFIDHGTGVVIGETCAIGERVRIYQGVTLGARTFPLDEQGRPIKGVPRHPIVEDDVVIYAGATILGRVTIGRGSTVGGNVWITRSLPARTHASQAQFRHEVFDGGGGI